MKSPEAYRRPPFLLLACAAALAVALAPGGKPEAADRVGARVTVAPFGKAGVLGGSNAHDDFSFRAPGGSVLFATAASNFYQTTGRRDGETDCGEDEGASASALASEDEGEDHGRELLCLQVIDATGDVLCWAERPAQPGWQRDPRLACAIDGDPAAQALYTLRVSYADDDCGDDSYPPAPVGKDGSPVATPYLIDGSLRPAASDGALF